MSKKLIIYHNDVNSVAFRKFKSVEHNIFDAIVYNFRDKGEEEITFSFDYLKKLINYKDNTSSNFPKLLDSMYEKLIKCNIKIGNNLEWTRFVLFTRYSISVPNQSVSIKINSEFAYILNNLQANFTKYELMESLTLKSNYTKVFYKHMMQFKNTGFWKVSVEEFKRLLDIPLKYRTCDIDIKVFKPILKEINGLNSNYNLKIEKLYEVKGRGRPSVSGFEFTFRKDSKADISLDDANNKVLENANIIVFFSKNFEKIRLNAKLRKELLVLEKNKGELSRQYLVDLWNWIKNNNTISSKHGYFVQCLIDHIDPRKIKSPGEISHENLKKDENTTSKNLKPEKNIGNLNKKIYENKLEQNNDFTTFKKEMYKNLNLADKK